MAIKKSFKRVATFFCNLIFPPRCVGCREFQQKNIFEECQLPLCEKCRVRWEYEKLSLCPDCGLEISLCGCGSRLLQKLEIEEPIKLVSYSAQKGSVGKSAVLYMKKKNNKRAVRYFAKQLSYPTCGRIKRSGFENPLFAYVPRSKKGIVEYGFDQSRSLAKSLAECCDADVASLFERTGLKRKEQKDLNLSARVKNAQRAYRLKKNAAEKLNGVDAVFIVDDVLTSGASLFGCASALKKIFDGEVVCVTIARTAKSRKK